MALKKPVVLTILDGWGYRAESFANAVALARKPTYDKLLSEYPHSLLHASDHFVGLPDGQMGNSEVGHLNIGSGRVVHMDITRIDDLIRSGEFFRHPVIVQALKHAGEKGRALHLLGLVSDGGVHSQQEHLHALLLAAKQQGVERVFVHAFLDGRDTLPTSGVGYLEKLQRKIDEIGVGKIASVGGRYFAMDRDRRWEREKKAFDAMTGRIEGGAYSDFIARVKECYHNGVTDEFVEPFVVVDAAGQPVGTVSDGDACICFNYRADRVRQITRVLARNSGLTKNDGKELPGAEDLDQVIPRTEVPKQLHYVCMTQYDKQFSLPMVILPESMENLLADMLAQANLRNLRIAETEKYAHVTYFFNGGIEKPFAGEDRVLVPSQKVATYDLSAGDERGRHCGRSDQGDWRSGVRPGGGELCQCRYGGALGQTGTNDSRGRDDRCVPGPHLSDSETARRFDVDYSGPRQRRVDDRSWNRRTPHLAYHKPGARDPGER